MTVEIKGEFQDKLYKCSACGAVSWRDSLEAALSRQAAKRANPAKPLKE